MRKCVAMAMVGGAVALAAGDVRAELAVTWRDIEPISNAAAFGATGLSGITHAGGESYWAVRDNSNQVLHLQISVSPAGTISSATIASGVTLSQTRDFEGIALGGGGTVLLAEEGTPGVHQYDLASGNYIASLPTPAVFSNRVANFGFESLARSGDGSTVWTANEEALSVDGPRSTAAAGSVVRLLRFDTSGADATAGAQYAYVTDPIHSAGGSDRSGLVDLVVLPDGRLLALERSAAQALPALVNRIYEIDLAGATDVSGIAGLIGESYTPVTKRLLWQGTADGLFGQNLEGLALGPQLAPGTYALVGVIDDGDPVSSNSVVTFELTGVPEPGGLALLGVGALGLLRRRR